MCKVLFATICPSVTTDLGWIYLSLIKKKIHPTLFFLAELLEMEHIFMGCSWRVPDGI